MRQYRIRSLLIVIAFVALVLAVAMLAVQQQRLRIIVEAERARAEMALAQARLAEQQAILALEKERLLRANNAGNQADGKEAEGVK